MIVAVSGQGLARAYDLRGTLESVKRIGARHIDLWPENLADLRTDVRGWTNRFEGKDVASAKRVLREAGVEVSAVSYPGAFFPDLASDVGEYALAFERAVEVASELDCRIVNHYLFSTVAPDWTYEPSTAERLFGRALRRASALGICLCLENEAHDATRTASRMRAILLGVGDRCFLTTFDPCNYYQAGDEGFPHALEALDPWLGYVHLKGGCVAKDAGPSLRNKGAAMTGRFEGEGFQYALLRDGAVNVDGLLTRLKARDYRGYLLLEPHFETDLLEEGIRSDARDVFGALARIGR